MQELSTNPNRDRYAARAEVFKALGNPARLMIVEALGMQPKCVADLTKLVDLDMSTVSRHLARLQQVGIIAGRRQGRRIYYSLRIPCVRDFFGCVESVLSENAPLSLTTATEPAEMSGE
jgi:ArsR family transcriptional regulator